MPQRVLCSGNVLSSLEEDRLVWIIHHCACSVAEERAQANVVKLDDSCEDKFYDGKVGSVSKIKSTAVQYFNVGATSSHNDVQEAFVLIGSE